MLYMFQGQKEAMWHRGKEQEIRLQEKPGSPPEKSFTESWEHSNWPVGEGKRGVATEREQAIFKYIQVCGV